MEIKRVTENDRIGEFINVEFSQYATDCDVALNFEEFCFVAEDDGKIAGVITGRAYYNEVHIGDLIVGMAYRRDGVGSKLVAAVEDAYRGKGYEKIALTTFGFQAPEFYKKLGYELEFVRKDKDPKLSKYFYLKKINFSSGIIEPEMDKQILFNNIDRIHTTDMERPEFNEIQDYDEFCKYYWYREELIKICKELGLKANGSKIELNDVIKAYFSGEKVLPEKRSIKHTKTTIKELTLGTGLIECGFTFGNRFREFYAEQTGVRPFKFNVDMVASAKAVKENGDESFTLGDLLDIYYGKRTYVKYDKSALQWNKFVKDFCADDATKIFDERLKAAASLWSIVRDSDMKKEYSHELFEKFKDSINI